MISANAIASIDWLFEKSLRDNCVASVEDHCAVSLKADIPPPAAGATHCLIALNISSYAFRIVALLDFGTDAATVAHLAKIMRRGDGALKDQALLDVFGEFANRVCGEVNRGLSATFRHVGMSTPFALENTCLGYLAILNPAQVRTVKVAINESVCFEVVVCICVDSETPLDFQVDRTEHAEAVSGELELF